MAGIRAIPGMREGLEEEVRRRKKPFLGICVGMQLLAEKGLEHGEHEGLGWLPATVKPITPRNKNLKVPHMGWNDLDITNPHPLLLGLAADAHAYFVHSYVMDCRDKKDVLATVEYGGDLVAIVARGNIMGTQFHPEKSQQTGLGIIHNFLKLRQA
jgi:glutamine amidotransferase